jgi:hypothetical protein
MKSKKLPKERNPFVLHLMKKKNGAHVKSKKSMRRSDKINLKKEYLCKVVF